MGIILSEFRKKGVKSLPQYYINSINKFISSYYNESQLVSFFDLFKFILDNDEYYKLSNSNFEISVFATESDEEEKDNFKWIVIQTQSKINRAINTYHFKKDDYGNKGFFLDILATTIEKEESIEDFCFLLEEIFFKL